MTKQKIKVLVVDDSAFMRLLLSDILSEDDGLDVVDVASNGHEAADKVADLRPDVVVLDMNMGEFDGIYAVKRIMAENPTPILILSAVGNSNLQPIFEALNLGAVDYMNKPNRSNSKMRKMNLELINKIKSAVRAKPRANNGAVSKTVTISSKEIKAKGTHDIIAIGASTGGPTAIEKIVSSLPSNLQVPVVICQHMPANFIQPFVNRLDGLCKLNVTVGVPGMVPRPGMVIVCPGNANTVVELDKHSQTPQIMFTDEQFPDYNNPSINALMLSVAKTYKSRAMGVILTGMGKDGARGLKAIKDAGGFTVAQDKASSVIFGMPKVANEVGAVNEVLDINIIGNFLIKNV